MALVLGAAFGSTGTRVEVRDAHTGRLVSSGSARHRDLGSDAADPTAWWRSLASAVAATGERDIAAMAVSGGHPGLVLLDGAGAVLRPLQPWHDGDATADASRLRKALGVDAWAQLTGALPAPSTAITRLAWVRRADPPTFERIGAALLPHDWLTYRLSGRAVTDRASASLTGAWSPKTGDWVDEAVALIAPGMRTAPWRSRLPLVLGPSDEADWLTAPVFELLGLRGRPLVGPGTTETMATALALGVRPGRPGVSLGTSTTVTAGCTRPFADPDGVVRCRGDAAGGLVATTFAGAGAPTVTAVATLLGVSPAELGAMALGTSVRPRTVVVPGLPGRAGAVLTGVAPGASREGVARATFLGSGCAVADALDAVADVGCEWDEDEPLRVAGPAEGIDAHAQTIADLTGRPVVASPAGPLAAAGACIQAAAVLLGQDPLEVSDAWDLGGDEWAEPSGVDLSSIRAAYQAERARQAQAIDAP